MFCTNCGKKIPDEGLFCVACGAPAPEDDPALRPPAPDTAPTEEPPADPEFEWATTFPEEHALRSDPVPRPVPRRRRKKKRRSVIIPIIVGALLLVLALAAMRIVNGAAEAPEFLAEKEPVTLSEHLGHKDWSFASVYRLKAGETVLKAQTDDDAAAMSLWEAIAELPFMPIEDSWAEQTLTDDGIFLTLAGGSDLLHLHISKDGALRIRGEGLPTLCCEDASEVYDVLKDYLPEEETFSLGQIIPAEGITSLSILHYDADDQLVYSTFLADPGEMDMILSILRDIAPAAGEGFHLDDLERMVFSVTSEGGRELRIEVLSDGCGDLPIGVWEYGICHENLFLILRDMVYIY